MTQTYIQLILLAYNCNTLSVLINNITFLVRLKELGLQNRLPVLAKEY